MWISVSCTRKCKDSKYTIITSRIKCHYFDANLFQGGQKITKWA